MDNLNAQYEGLLCAEDHMSPESAKVKHGLLQSCPLSPLLLSTAFLAWERRAAEGRRDQTTATVCVDDRTFWHTGDSGTDHKIGKMMQDLDMGKKFNEPFGLLGTTRSSRMRKTTLSPRKEVKTIQELAKISVPTSASWASTAT